MSVLVLLHSTECLWVPRPSSPATSRATRSHSNICQFLSTTDDASLPDKKNATESLENASSSLSLAQQEALSLQIQAQRLKDEANAMRKQLQKEQEQALAKRQAKIDAWIDELLIQMQVGGNDDDDDDTPEIQLLKTVEQVLERLQEDRYSQEQINAIFNRICETGPKQSRSNCSPIMELLVDAVGKMDEVDRAENPNKRWSGKVERVLRKRLFAMDWNMDLEEDEDGDDDMNPWRLR